jgi:hypothetical protein
VRDSKTTEPGFVLPLGCGKELLLSAFST